MCIRVFKCRLLSTPSLHKIRLVLDEFLVDAYSSSTIVHRLQGVSFHRLQGVSFHRADLFDRAVVIRTPRFEFVPPLADEAAVLSFVRSHNHVLIRHL